MKTLITLIILLSSVKIFAQINYLENKPIWRQEKQFFFDCLVTEEFMYYINGDTTINNLEYKKLYDRHQTTYSNGPPSICGSEDYFDLFRLLLRQENKKIFVYFPVSDILLYDFNLKIGDSLQSTYNVSRKDIVVSSIDSISVGNSYRSVFSLKIGEDSVGTLIEGIGFNTGFLEDFPELSGISRLLCFNLNDTTYYPNYGANCNLSLGLPMIFSLDKLKIFPNPVKDYLTIEYDINKSIQQIDIYDLCGNNIQHEFESSENGLILDFSSKKNGVYFIKLTFKNETPKICKVVKI
ncbi:MAG: T9SS type A sorting domain-containing protein [Bacteroidales bacterium]|nr:T9SS type A sorting domain-containing protein [Bacteroidales bacterium]